MTVSRATLLGLAMGLTWSTATFAQKPPVFLMMDQPLLASYSFLFDDCGEAERGEKFRADLVKGVELCSASNITDLKQKIGASVANSRKHRMDRVAASRGDAPLCKDRRPEFWGILFDLERRFAQGDPASISEALCSRSARVGPASVQ